MAYIIRRKIPPNKFLNLFLIKKIIYGFLTEKELSIFVNLNYKILGFKKKIKNKIKNFVNHYFLLKKKYFLYGETLENEKFLQEIFISAMTYEFSLKNEAISILQIISMVKKKIWPNIINNNSHSFKVMEIKNKLASIFNVTIFCSPELLKDFEWYFKESLVFTIVRHENISKIIINNKKKQQELFVSPPVIEKIFKRAYKRSQELFGENLYAPEC